MANWTKKKEILDKTVIDALSGQISEKHEDIQQELIEHGLYINTLKQEVDNINDDLSKVLWTIQDNDENTIKNFNKLNEETSKQLDEMGKFFNKNMNSMREEHSREMKSIKIKLYLTITALLVLSILALK